MAETKSPDPSSDDSGERPTAQAMRLHNDGQVEAAEALLRETLAGNDAPEALHRLGLLSLQKGEQETALRFVMVAADLDPRNVSIRNNLSNILYRMGRYEEALEVIRALVAEYPLYPYVYTNLALVLDKLGEPKKAIDVLLILAKSAIEARQPGFLDIALEHLRRFQPAPLGLVGIANLLRLSGEKDRAIQLCDYLLKSHPDDLGIQLIRCMAFLPVAQTSVGDNAASLQAYDAALIDLARKVERATVAQLVQGSEQVGLAKPFYLSYFGGDDRERQRVYGAIVTRMMSAAIPDPAGPGERPPETGDGKIRVGFASGYFALHSVSKLFNGWMRHLDRRRFAVFAYELSNRDVGDWGQAALDSCDAVRRNLQGTADWAKVIATDRLDVLIYPEIGMQNETVRLATLRLAPVQCVAFGHPVTTGLATIDYVLASDLMEPADGDRHYTEALVRLPNLGVFYEPLPSQTGRMTRADLGLDADAVVFVCCQTTMKYHVADDGLFSAVATWVPKSQFLVICDADSPAGRLLKQRLEASFVAAGLPVDRLRFVPPVSGDDFSALLATGDIYLDTLRWSGGNTTLEAIAVGLPIVTCPGPLMRGRTSAAILTYLGLADLIAATPDAYVALAAALGNDRQKRSEVVARIRTAAPRLFGDPAVLPALEDFLIRATGRT